MAGVKGRSGGARPNTGGARPGAGRPRTKPDPEQQEPEWVSTRDPLEFLLDVMQGKVKPTALQVRAAVCAAQYLKIKAGDGGKKDAVDAMARSAEQGTSWDGLLN